MVGVAVLVLTPRLFDLDVVLNVTVYMIMAVLALSLALVWGFGGILCFGQAAFFGLGAYTYAIAMFNIGESTAPLLLAILAPAAFAALLGYFMFYGRISDVFLGVITLTVTLILFNSINSTAGPEFHIGSARLGGFNGIPGIPSLNMPFFKDWQIDLEGMFYLSTASLILAYFGLRALLASHFGRTIVGIRENEQRAQLLGYDPRFYKLATFTIGAALAGYAGCLFVNWGSFVSPTIFGLAQSAQIIIWVIVGGRGTLIGPILGAASASRRRCRAFSTASRCGRISGLLSRGCIGGRRRAQRSTPCLSVWVLQPSHRASWANWRMDSVSGSNSRGVVHRPQSCSARRARGRHDRPGGRAYCRACARHQPDQGDHRGRA